MRDARSNVALEVHSRRTRVEPAKGLTLQEEEDIDWGQRRGRPLVSLSFQTPPAHYLAIKLITDTFDLISKQGRRHTHLQGAVQHPFQIRIVPLSTDLRPQSNGHSPVGLGLLSLFHFPCCRTRSMS